MQKYVLYVLMALVATGCLDGGANKGQEEVLVEDTAVASALDLENAKLDIHDFEGLQRTVLNKRNDSTYIVNFWATWCKPCVKELPYFERIGQLYSEDKVKVVLVSLDFPEHIESKVIPFLEERQLRSQVLLLDDTDMNTWIPKVDKDWQGSIPATLIFNKSSRKFFEKQFTFEELETEIQSILK